MRILVIGGSRFVGPIVVHLLLKHNHEITIFNRGLEKEEYPAPIRFVQGNREEGFGLEEKFDVVIDTCAYHGAQTEVVLKELHFDFLVHLGSVASYRKPITFPVREGWPQGPWPAWAEYGRGKGECELVLTKSGIAYASLRPTYILGPENYLDRENFIYSRILKGTPLVLPGNGQAVVQFVFAREVAESLVYLAEGKVAGAFNCCGDEAITLTSLVEQMANISGTAAKISYDPEHDQERHDPSQFPFANENSYYSNEKIKSLGRAFTPLLAGLKKDYQSYYRSHLKLS